MLCHCHVKERNARQQMWASFRRSHDGALVYVAGVEDVLVRGGGGAYAAVALGAETSPSMRCDDARLHPTSLSCPVLSGPALPCLSCHCLSV